LLDSFMSSDPYLLWLPGKYIGGAERYALNLCLNIASDGIPVVILCPYIDCYDGATAFLSYHVQNLKLPIQIIFANAPSASRFWKLPLISTIHILFWIRNYSTLLSKIKPVAVHIVQPFPTRSFTFISAAAQKRSPVTITFQLVPCPTTLPKRYRVLYRKIVSSTAFTFVSKSNLLSLSKAISISPSSLHYIPNRPVPCSGFLSPTQRQSLLSQLNLHPDHFICSTVAALVLRKGHEDIINACSLLIEHTTSVHFLFIGAGTHETYLRDLAMRRGVSDYIHFLGNRNDVDCVLQVSNAFIFPSSAEGLSFALMEAVQRHVPLIASNSCGADDFLTPGIHYRSYEAGDSSHLEVQIKEVMKNIPEAIYSANLAASELSNYSFQDMYGDTLDIVLRST
jgi:glycosyltransferase involved in cell wall biosynthesis